MWRPQNRVRESRQIRNKPEEGIVSGVKRISGIRGKLETADNDFNRLPVGWGRAVKKPKIDPGVFFPF